jgi:phenylalanyl-tRNA synthetase alpha chain
VTDRARYRPVSAMPPIRRDLSVAVEAADTAEDLGDRVRDALGPDADGVEEVAVLAETPSDQPVGRAIPIDKAGGTLQRMRWRFGGGR